MIWGPDPGVLRACAWLCDHEYLLARLWGPYGVSGDQTWLSHVQDQRFLPLGAVTPDTPVFCSKPVSLTLEVLCGVGHRVVLGLYGCWWPFCPAPSRPILPPPPLATSLLDS